MKYLHLIKIIALCIILPIIVVELLNKFLFFQIIVPSDSMYPTIKENDRILVTNLYDKNKLVRGDIVVFYSEELKKTLVKRLIGLPGDLVSIKYGEIFINEKKISEPYVVCKDSLTKNFKVPVGCFLFLGDNRFSSYDSRYWKNPYIKFTNIKGKAQIILYPFKRFGKFITGKRAL